MKGEAALTEHGRQWSVHFWGSRNTLFTPTKNFAHTKQTQALVNRLTHTQQHHCSTAFPPPHMYNILSTYHPSYLPMCPTLLSCPLPSCLLLPIPGSTSLYRFLPWLIGSRATLIGPASDFAFTRSCCIQRNTYMDIL